MQYSNVLSCGTTGASRGVTTRYKDKRLLEARFEGFSNQVDSVTSCFAIKLIALVLSDSGCIRREVLLLKLAAARLPFLVLF